MPSIETLELISTVAWKIYGKTNSFQEKFWLKQPAHWDDLEKRASFRPISECIPLLLVTVLQVPTILYSIYIVYCQLVPRHSEPRFPFIGLIIVAFAGGILYFVTVSSFSNFYKRKEWALCLNVMAMEQFHKKTKTKKPTIWTKASPCPWRDLSIIDLITNGTFAFLLFLAFSGITIPFVTDADILTYYFIDLPRDSREWYFLKFAIRPACWFVWSCYCIWIFYDTAAHIFFIILHGCSKIPRVPKKSKSQKLTVIQNSLVNLTFGQRLAHKLMEAAYKEYRQFQIFIRPGNDAAFISIPCGVAGIVCAAVMSGFVTIKAYHLFPLNIYLMFPSILLLGFSLIAFMVPIAFEVFESALEFKRYWLSRFLRKEVRKRIISLRPMGIAAGPFGYIHKSLSMKLAQAVVDFICSLCLSVSM